MEVTSSLPFATASLKLLREHSLPAFLPFLSRLWHWGPRSALWQPVCSQSEAADEWLDLLP